MNSLGMIILRLFTVVFAIAVLGTVFFLGGHGGDHYKTTQWPFDGVTGKLDKASAKRGFRVYKEVCAGCHGLRQMAYRNLEAIGFTEDEVKEIAAEYEVTDGPNDDGEMFDRPAKASDRFVSPFANKNAARASNNGAYPPDLSLIVKARHDGANYLYSLLQGYSEDVPEDVTLADGMSYNEYFGTTKQIAMPQPLWGDDVEYEDGTEATLEQEAKDVTVFLQWASEPEMQDRKELGMYVVAFLMLFTVLFWLAKKRVWARLKD